VYLSEFDLQQLDEATVSQWTPSQKEARLVEGAGGSERGARAAASELADRFSATE
jgi:hypothetical protein